MQANCKRKIIQFFCQEGEQIVPHPPHYLHHQPTLTHHLDMVPLPPSKSRDEATAAAKNSVLEMSFPRIFFCLGPQNGLVLFKKVHPSLQKPSDDFIPVPPDHKKKVAPKPKASYFVIRRFSIPRNFSAGIFDSFSASL